MHRKIELQAPADYTYLYANTINLSRQKLDLHLPPSATTNDGPDPDPMRERVRELVDEVSLLSFLTHLSLYIWILIQVAVHNKNLHNSLHLHQRQRPRRRATIPPPARDIRLGSPHRARGNGRVRSLRHQPRCQGDFAVRAARVVDYHRCAAETRCATAGCGDVC